jgi:hypothetical protein
VKIWRYGFTRYDGEIQDTELAKDNFDQYGVEGFRRRQENRVGLPLLVEVSVDLSKKRQLKRPAKPVSEPELLITQQTTLVYVFQCKVNKCICKKNAARGPFPAQV